MTALESASGRELVGALIDKAKGSPKIMTGTKICPDCEKVIGRTVSKCECGHEFPKGHGRGKKADAPKRDWKQQAERAAPRAAAEKESTFRVGIFNDGGLAILAALGSLELSPEEAEQLAGFCAQHFGDE